MVNFSEIANRIKNLTGKKRDKELAELFNISPADYLNRKKRGTLLPLIIQWAIHESVNIHWLLTGEGPMRLEREAPLTQPYPNTNKHAEVYALVREILESGDDFVIKALKERLADYRVSVAMNRERRSIQQRLARIEQILERSLAGGGLTGGGSLAGPDAPQKEDTTTGVSDTGKKVI